MERIFYIIQTPRHPVLFVSKVMIRVRWTIALLAVVVATAARADSDHFPGKFWHKVESPQQVGWSNDRLTEAREFSASLDTTSFMVVHDGIVVDEWGAVALPLKCHSVRKSLLSAIYGPHVATGTIELDSSLAELGIDDKEPSLSDEEKQARIRDLLAARSGIYHPALYETAAMAAARPQRGSHAGNTFWYYNNWDFNASATIFENLTGHSVFEEFERRLAEPLQMQDFVRSRHTRYVTGDESVHPAYPFELSTRDLARFGLLLLRGGRWDDQQLISADWVAESTQSYSDAGPSGGYGYMWWVAVDGRHFPGVSLPERSFSARGHRGQYLVVIPEWNIVVAHRVNSFLEGTRVSKADFGKLLHMILDARPTKERSIPTASNGDSKREPVFDLILAGGNVMDGLGNKAFQADVGIRDGHIAAMGNLEGRAAERVIDVTAKTVAPGFIDLHSHAEKGLTSKDPLRRAAPNLVTQGITTVVVNQDGGGPESIREQRRVMRKLGIGPNVIQLVGHGSIRRQVMKEEFRRPSSDVETDQMRKLVLRGMREGAWGLSAGLEYVPGRWSTAAEMQSIVSELASFDGVYVLHERSSGSHPMWFLPSRDKPSPPSMIDNLRELIEVADKTGVTVVATHIKARGVDFWGSSRIMIDMIEKAREDGVQVFADQYAYNTSGSDGRIVLIPDWVAETQESKSGENKSDEESTPAEQLERALSDTATAVNVRRDIAFEIARRGGPDSILILEHPEKAYVGKSVAELAGDLSCEPVEVAIRLQLEGDRTRRGGARLRAFSMSELDVEAFAKTPWTATSSDAGIALPDDGPVHPRFYGAFPRKIRHYAIDRQTLSVEEAVRVSTSLPAQILKLEDRGTIAVNQAADIVVFDPKSIRDTADAFHPHRFCEGIDHVLIDGVPVVEEGRCLGTLAGQVLDRRSFLTQRGEKEKRAEITSWRALARKLDEVTPDLMATHKTPGVSIALVADGDIVWRQCFGVTQADSEDPVTTDTIFEACSMSKPVFAYAFLKLVEEGQFDLERPLVEYLDKPYIPDDPRHEEISAKMVLTHTTGFPNWRKGGWRSGNPLAVRFQPGAKFGYSGEGFWYLQQVVEQVVGKETEPWMQSLLLQPLDMRRSSFTWQPEFESLAAAGHDRQGDAKEDRGLYHQANTAFTLYTTPTDYALFLVEIMRKDRSARHSLSSETIRTMLEPTIETDRPKVWRSLGWVATKSDTGTLISHSGSNGTGFRCYAQFDPVRRSGLVIMTNAVNGDGVWQGIVNAINLPSSVSATAPGS